MPNVHLRCGSLAGPQRPDRTEDNSPWRGGPQREAIISRLHGSWYHQHRQSLAWEVHNTGSVSTDLGNSVIGDTAPAVCIWNPAGNTMAVVPVAFAIHYSGQNPAIGVPKVVGFSKYFGGDKIGTGEPITAFTDISLNPSLIGTSYTGRVRACSGATLRSAPTLHRWASLGVTGTPGAAQPVGGPFTAVHMFYDSLVIPPGWLIAAQTSAVTNGLGLTQAWWCYEVPWP